MSQSYNAVINSVPAANALRRVEGFNPLKFLRRIRSERTGAEVLKLELPYQKLWFRLACPNGRMVLNNLRITDQLAIFEAIVFSDKGDGEPLSKITASATRGDTPNGQYIQAAQDKALSEALENAGFGIQICDIAESAGRSDYGSVVPVAQPQEESGDLPFTMASAAQLMCQVTPQAQNTAPPVQQAQPAAASQTQTAPAAAPATTQVVEQTQAPQMQENAPAENNGQPEAPASATPAAAPETVTEAAPTSATPETAAEPAAAPMQTQTAAPTAEPTAAPTPTAKTEGKAEESAARLPTSLELLRASTQAQVITFPTSNTTPAQDAASAQPAPDDNGGEAPMNTAQAAGNYTADMTVDEISEKMTLEEARAVVVNEGICKGWTLGQVAESRPASLRFYVHSNRSDNVLKAAAKLVMDNATLKQAG